MKPMEQLQQEQRRVQAVDAALHQVPGLRAQAAGLQLLATQQQKGQYAAQLLGGPGQQSSGQGASGESGQGGGGGGLQPATQALVGHITTHHTQAAHVSDMRRAGRVRELDTQARLLQQQEAARGRQARRGRGVQAAMAEDRRLAQLPALQALQAHGGVHGGGQGAVSRQGAGSQHHGEADGDEHDDDTDTGSGEEEEEEDEDEDEMEEEQGEGEEDEEDDEDEDEVEEEEGRRMATQLRAEVVAVRQARTTGALLQQLRVGRGPPLGGGSQAAGSAHQLSGRGGGAGSQQLSPLVAALRRDLQEQQGALGRLRTQHQALVTRLGWVKAAPAAVQGELAVTREHGAHHQLCLHMVWDLVELAWSSIQMRPTREQVAVEVAQAQVQQQQALRDIVRHMADALVKDTVDAVIAQVADEELSLGRAATSFALDMLVEAVASSQDRFHISSDAIRPRLQALSQQQQKLDSQRRIAANQAAAAREVARAAAQQRVRELREQSVGSAVEAVGPLHILHADTLTDHGEVYRKQHWQEDETAAEDSIVGPASQPVQGNLRAVRGGPTTTGTTLPQRDFKFGDAELFDDDDVYGVTRLFDRPKLRRGAKQQYVLALKAMLQEMRKRRGDAPFGHTQHLRIRWPRGLHLTQVQKATAIREQPRLAARPCVWRSRRVPPRKLAWAPFSGDEAVQAAVQEAQFWEKVVMSPFWLNQDRTPLVHVLPRLGPVTCISPSPSGAFLAVVGDGSAEAPAMPAAPTVDTKKSVTSDTPTGRAPRQWPPVRALTWSADSLQVATLDGSGALCIWCLTPAAGQVVQEEPERQPVAPELLLALTPRHMAATGKAAVVGGGMLADGAAAGADPPAACALSLAFHPAFTITGWQPQLCLTQASGDILRLDLSRGASTLPLESHLSLHLRAGSHLPGADPPVRLSQPTVSFLTPSQEGHPTVSGQSLYRGHQGGVVFLGFLADNSTMISVDQQGRVVCWPSREGQRSGFGWFSPSASWAAPPTLPTCHPRGDPAPVWPRSHPSRRLMLPPPPAAALPPAAAAAAAAAAPAPAVGGVRSQAFSLRSLFGRGTPPPPAAAQGSPAPAPSRPPFTLPPLPTLSGTGPLHSPLGFDDYAADTSLHDAEEELQKLEGEAEGGFLLLPRRPWLTIYRWDTSADKQGRLVRETVHRPLHTAGQGQPLVITVTAPGPTPLLLARYKQHAVVTNVPFTVVSARLTPSRRDLVIVCWVPPQPGDPSSWSFFSLHVVSLATMACTTPRIDVYDHSQGSAAPAYALSPAITALGSDYCFFGLGCGAVAVYSLATGQLVREDVFLGMPALSPHFVALELIAMTGTQGKGRNHGRMLLAAVPSGSVCVHLYLINDEVSTDDTLRRRHQSALVRLVPQPQRSPQPPRAAQSPHRPNMQAPHQPPHSPTHTRHSPRQPLPAPLPSPPLQTPALPVRT